MKQSLEMRQGQSLVMTQQLQQSIKLLQYSSVELSEFISEELEANPMLAVDDGHGRSTMGENTAEGNKSDGAAQEGASSGEDSVRDTDATVTAETASESMDASDEAIWGGETQTAETSYDNSQYEPPSGMASSSSGGGSAEYLADVIEQRVSEAVSLRDHLLEQVNLMFTNAADKLTAATLVDALDEGGYLRDELSGIAEQIGTDAAEVESVLLTLQQCDPAGVFARDLKECLKLQLVDRNRFDPIIATVLDNLEMIEGGNLKKLAKKCELSEEEMLEILAEVRTLDPRPGSHFSTETVQTLVPDVYVRRQPDGKWRVELNSDVLPRVLVNREYHTEIVSKARQKDDKKFINEHLANANWLVRALDQRANTVMKVSAEIVRKQEAFFEKGVNFLKPMTLREIAEEVDLHESSVSRVTTNKYMSTGRGVFELKYFFSSSLSGALGDGEYSSRSVMNMIKDVIDAEPKEKILSDDAIAALLNAKGIDVARRTVVKYRTKLGIPSSVQRRRIKNQL